MAEEDVEEDGFESLCRRVRQIVGEGVGGEGKLRLSAILLDPSGNVDDLDVRAVLQVTYDVAEGSRVHRERWPPAALVGA